MNARQTLHLGAVLIWSLLVVSAPHAMGFNPELWEMTGGPTRNVYTCSACTFEQYLNTPLPGSDWARNASEGNPRLFLPDFGTSVPPTVPAGTALSLDLIPEIEGDEYTLIARVLSASLLGFGAQGPIANAQVARGTTMTFDAGRLIHKVTSPAGVAFALFSISEIHTTQFDHTVAGGLAGMDLPSGWDYSSEVLSSDLVVGTPSGIANVYSVPDYWTWQEIIVVPEPSTGVLLGLSLAMLAGWRDPRRGRLSLHRHVGERPIARPHSDLYGIRANSARSSGWN